MTPPPPTPPAQIFDSWACNLTPADFDIFSLPYLKHIITEVRGVAFPLFGRLGRPPRDGWLTDR